jgi:hypothetical protein
MLRFPYQDEPLTGPAPPSLALGATDRGRPLIPVEIFGTGGLSRQFTRAFVDPAADDTVFPLDTARQIGAVLRPDTGHRVRWRGQLHAPRFGGMEILLEDGINVWRWPAIIRFSPAQIRYPILGTSGCLQFLDAHFRGAHRIVELETNPTFPGTVV